MYVHAERMEWSAASATKAYLDTIKLCGDHKRRCDQLITREPGRNEFISALAAGMKAKLIVEVTYGVSPSTIALATAARHTGGRLVCILPEPVLAENKKVIKESGLKDLVEFRTGDPSQLLSDYKNIDFSLVDCKNKDHTSRLMKLIDVNPIKSVVVANNLVGGKKALGEDVISRGIMKNKDEIVVKSTKLLVGKGMEVTVIGKSKYVERKDRRRGGGRGCNFLSERRVGGGGKKKEAAKSKWIVKVDKLSGEEHIFRDRTGHDHVLRAILIALNQGRHDQCGRLTALLVDHNIHNFILPG